MRQHGAAGCSSARPVAPERLMPPLHPSRLGEPAGLRASTQCAERPGFARAVAQGGAGRRFRPRHGSCDILCPQDRNGAKTTPSDRVAAKQARAATTSGGPRCGKAHNKGDNKGGRTCARPEGHGGLAAAVVAGWSLRTEDPSRGWSLEDQPRGKSGYQRPTLLEACSETRARL